MYRLLVGVALLEFCTERGWINISYSVEEASRSYKSDSLLVAVATVSMEKGVGIL